MGGLATGAALIAVGLALVWVAWVGSQRKLPPNHWVGIRTRSTRASDSAWYAAHEVAAGPLGVSGGLTALLGAGVVTTGMDVFGVIATAAALALTLVGSGYAAFIGVRAARRAAG